ncbi:cytochrome P450 [Clavulina sp. PMI_390]|nr:cytochrome P450 [Clavulina sp. PMI_390]
MTPIERLRRTLLRLLGLCFVAITLVVAFRYPIYKLLQIPSSATYLTTLFGLLVLHLGLSSVKTASSTGNSPPKVKGWLPGNVDILWKLVQGERSEYCAATLRDWEQRYGPTYDMNILWGHQIVTSDPVNVKEILATNFSQFEKSRRLRDMLVNFLGDGIFTSDGDEWKNHRAIARPFFSRERVTDYEIFEKNTQRLIRRLLSESGAATSLNIQELYSQFTIDSIAEFLLGIELNTLDGKWSTTTNETGPFVKAFEELQSISMTRIRIGTNWPIFELFGDRSEKPAKVLNEYIEPIVEMSMRPEGRESENTRGTYLQYLVETVNNPKIVRDAVVSLLLAGRDTTASLLSFVTYCLAIHPEKATIIREEINSILSVSGRPPTAEDIKQMRYLRAFINETLRLFPPLPMNIRRANQDTTLTSPLSNHGPFFIKKNVSVTIASIMTQRSKAIWGEDAEEFKPERWLVSPNIAPSQQQADSPGIESEDSTPNAYLKNLTHVSNPYAFTPFNAGPRICLGQSFALSECAYTIIRLLQTFESFELDEAKQPLPIVDLVAAAPGSRFEREASEKCWPRASLTLYIEGGLWIKLRPNQPV